MRKLISAGARKNKRTARMLANAREDHSISLKNLRYTALHQEKSSCPGADFPTILIGQLVSRLCRGV